MRKKKPEDIASRAIWVTKRTHQRISDYGEPNEERMERIVTRILNLADKIKNKSEE